MPPPRWPDTDEVHAIEPDLRERMCGMVAWLQVKRAAQVDVEDAVVARRIDVHDLHRLRDAGVVDQDIDVAERLDARVDGGFALVELGDVANEADMIAAKRGCRLNGGVAVDIENGDAGAVFGEQPCGCKADAVLACSAGNNRGLALEHHGVHVSQKCKFFDALLAAPPTLGKRKKFTTE